MDRLILEDMTWPEVAEVLPEIKVALIPVGSCEQHGPNTTFVTDTVRAYRIAKLLAGRCGHKVICFPPITYGISSHHMDFPCSATLRVSTLTAVLVDTALSAVHYGIDKVLFVNAHGGNKPCLMSAVQILKQEHDVTAFWTPVGSELLEGGIQKYFPGIQPGDFGHACEMEPANGALGDARKATAEIGEAMTNEVLDYLERLVDKIIAYQPTPEKLFK